MRSVLPRLPRSKRKKRDAKYCVSTMQVIICIKINQNTNVKKNSCAIYPLSRDILRTSFGHSSDRLAAVGPKHDRNFNISVSVQNLPNQPLSPSFLHLISILSPYSLAAVGLEHDRNFNISIHLQIPIFISQFIAISNFSIKKSQKNKPTATVETQYLASLNAPTP